MILPSFPSIALLSALCFPSVYAFVPDVPRQTSTSDEPLHAQGWTPRPTDDPSHHPLNIFKRQIFPDFPGDAGTILVAPDHTCGYIGTLQGAPFSCSSKYKCLLFSATGSNYGPVACCTTGMSCRIRTACVASTDFYGPSSDSFCGSACKLDAYTLKCTDSREPYCGNVRFTSPNVQDYWCIQSPVTGIYSAATTFSGQAQRVFTTVNKTDLWPVSTSSSSTTSSTTSTGISSSSSSSTSSSRSSAPTSDDVVNPPSSTPTPSSSPPLGAIIGGVLGGIAVIAIAGFGAFLLWRRYKKKKPHQPVGGPVVMEPYTEYNTGRAELDTLGQGHMMTSAASTPSPQYGVTTYGAGGHQQYYDAPKPQEPQELYGSTGGAAGGGLFPQKSGSYQQVPTSDQQGAYYTHQSAILPPGAHPQFSDVDSRTWTQPNDRR